MAGFTETISPMTATESNKTIFRNGWNCKADI